MTTTARQIMSTDVRCVRTSETVLDAAKRMAELGVGALPIRGADDRLMGMLTDRDIVVRVLAAGKDPGAVHAGELAQGAAVTIGADDGTEEILRAMAEHKVRRLPVLDGYDLVGVVSQADVARTMSNVDIGGLVNALSVDY